MKDASHGSAYPKTGLEPPAHRELTVTISSSYHGTSKHNPHRGKAHTAPRWIRLASGHCPTGETVTRVALDVDKHLAPTPCWSGRAQTWAQITVPKAYAQRYDSHVRPAMPNNPISLSALIAVAEARASHADHRTGRNCRPTNARLARMTGLSIRTVQRASTALRLLGVATEVLRGRPRNQAERYAGRRVGDRARGWASVWTLHDCRIRELSPHPVGSQVISQTPVKEITTNPAAPKRARKRAATRRTCPESRAMALANAWKFDQQSPSWARQYGTQTWARILAGPARHDWTVRDVNQLIRDWAGVGNWIPTNPHKPIGLLGAIVKWHGHDNLDDRPAVLEDARRAAERHRDRQRRAADQAVIDRGLAARARALAEHNTADRVSARQAVRRELERIAQRGYERRSQETAAEAAQREAQLRSARAHREGWRR